MNLNNQSLNGTDQRMFPVVATACLALILGMTVFPGLAAAQGPDETSTLGNNSGSTGDWATNDNRLVVPALEATIGEVVLVTTGTVNQPGGQPHTLVFNSDIGGYASTPRSVAAGASFVGNATGNTLTIDTSASSGIVAFGGIATATGDDVTVINNKVTVQGAGYSLSQAIIGGAALPAEEMTAEISGNTVEFLSGSSSALAFDSVYGAVIYAFNENAGGGTADLNGVTIRSGAGALEVDWIVGAQVDGSVTGFSASSLTNNFVDIEASTTGLNVDKGVYGANLQDGIIDGDDGPVLDNNSVVIKSGQIGNNVIYPSGFTPKIAGATGGVLENAKLTNNSVEIYDTVTVWGDVYGALVTYSVTDTNEISENTVDINGGTINGNVYGASGVGGTVSENIATMNGGSIFGDIIGGMGVGGTVSENIVEMTGGTVSKYVIGGYTISWEDSSLVTHVGAQVTGNTVTMTGGTASRVYGGYAWTENLDPGGDVSENTVELSGTTTTVTNVYGGLHEGAGNAIDNHVKIEDLTNSVANVYGGVSGYGGASGNANGNDVTIANGSVTGSVYGGSVRLGSGSASENEVFLNDGSNVGQNVYGAIVNSAVGTAVQNKVTIDTSATTASANATVGGIIYGAYVAGDGAATENSVDVIIGDGYKAEVSNIFGALLVGEGDASENSVSIACDDLDHCNSSTSVQTVTGAVATTGNVVENSVSISGAVAAAQKVTGGITTGGNATKNFVKVEGGVAGARSDFSQDLIGGESDAGLVSGNHVDLDKAANAQMDVIGGRSISGSGKVEENFVKITGGTAADFVNILGELIGGKTATNDATKNYVSISGKIRAANGVTGGLTTLGAVSENYVKIEGGVNMAYADIVGEIIGGLTSGSNVATGNYVSIDGKLAAGDAVTGGRTTDGAATGNYVEVAGGTSTDKAEFTKNVVGGETNTGAASGNSVTITGASSAAEDVIGGRTNAGTGDAINNDVTIKGGAGTDYTEVKGSVIGGISNGGNVENSDIKISGKAVLGTSSTDEVVAGKVLTGTGEASSNKVDISLGTAVDGGATVAGSLYAGYSQGGNVATNSVTISGTADIKGNLVAGNIVSGNGNADNNDVTITGTTAADYVNVGGTVIGGLSYGGKAVNSDLKISGHAVLGTSSTDEVVAGKVLTGTGEASSNKVDISLGTAANNGTTVAGSLYAGYSNGGNVDANSVTISGKADITGNLVAGNIVSGSGNADNNDVTISGTATDYTEVNGSVIGGLSYGGKVENSDLIFTGKTVLGDSSSDEVVAGKVISGTGEASRNKVDISGGTTAIGGTTLTGSLYAGYSQGGKVDSNSVTISGKADIAGDLVAGNSVSGSVQAYDNKVTLKDGNSITQRTSVGGDLIAGITNAGIAWKNIIDVTNAAQVLGDVVAGRSTSGSSEQNEVHITAGASSATGLVASSTTSIIGGESTTGTATGNKIWVSGFVSSSATAGQKIEAIVGGQSRGDANNNEVYIQCNQSGSCVATAATNIVGGESSFGGTTNNAVKVTGNATATNVIGGISSGLSTFNTVDLSGTSNISGYATGGQSTGSSANGNNLDVANFINLGTGSLYGGFTTATNGSANNNKVNLSGNNTLRGSLYGGYSTGTSGFATGNEVNLSGMLTLLGTPGDLYGGYARGSAASAGNTLFTANLDHSGEFALISGFDKYDITATSTQVQNAIAGSQSLLPGKDIDFNVTGTELTLTIGDNTYTYHAGQTAQLVSNDVLNPQNVSNFVISQPTAFVTYNAQLTTNGIEIYGQHTDAQATALSETPLADVSFVNRGTDLIAGEAIPAALASVMGEVGLRAFAAVDYSRYRARTGSHIEVNGVSGDVGLAFGKETSLGVIVVGIFLEFGQGSYDSYNQYSGLASVHGKGDLEYFGGGFFGRLDLGSADSSRLYFELSGRFGKTDANFTTDEFQSLPGVTVDYKFHSKYWGFHTGVGYVFDLKNRLDATIDFSTKYFHTVRDGADFMIFNRRAVMSDVTSSRILAGARLTLRNSHTVKFYFGAYYEHEFDGASQVTFADLQLPDANLRGSTGVGEVGIIVSKQSSPVEFQMGVQGTSGKRDGFSGHMGLRYTF